VRRKTILVALAALGTALAGAGSKEARAAQLAKLKADLSLSGTQAAQTERLLADLDKLRDRIAAASRAKKPGEVEAAKDAFRKRRSEGFRAILTPEQFAKWEKMSAPPPDGAAAHHHHP
jgi:hypothetical protein